MRPRNAFPAFRTRRDHYGEQIGVVPRPVGYEMRSAAHETAEACERLYEDRNWVRFRVRLQRPDKVAEYAAKGGRGGTVRIGRTYGQAGRGTAHVL
jgi:hypothetical protein